MDDGEWALIEPEAAFTLWKLWKSFGEQVPLFAGGLMDWPEWVLHDFKIIEWQNRIARHALDLK